MSFKKPKQTCFLGPLFLPSILQFPFAGGLSESVCRHCPYLLSPLLSGPRWSQPPGSSLHGYCSCPVHQHLPFGTCRGHFCCHLVLSGACTPQPTPSPLTNCTLPFWSPLVLLLHGYIRVSTARLLNVGVCAGSTVASLAFISTVPCDLALVVIIKVTPSLRS